MVWQILIGVTLLSYAGTGSLFASAANATRCFECKDVPLPADCDTVTQCTDGQICTVEHFITSGGLVLYNSGCVSEPSCHLKRRDIVSDDVTELKKRSDVMVCQQCCDGDYCNNQGCGSHANTQPNRGPYCFECDVMASPDQCRTVVTCDKGEVCMMIENKMPGVDGKPTYRTKCASPMDCQAGEQVSIFGKKRATRCHTCCHGDFCNNKCDYEQVSTSATPLVTSHTTSSTTVTQTVKVTTQTPTITPPPTTTTTLPTTTNHQHFQDICHAHHYTYDSHSNLCFRYHTTRRTWSDANHHCQNEGGLLAIIDTRAKWDVFRHRIFSEHSHTDVFIGGRDTGHADNSFHWTDGRPVTNHAWYHGQPDGGNEDCIYVNHHDHLWHDTGCYHHMAYVCTISPPH